MNPVSTKPQSPLQAFLSRSTRLGTALLLAIAALGAVLVLMALAAPGDPDPEFGSDGATTTDFDGGEDKGLDLAVQADGKIVVGGYTEDSSGGGDTDFALARYTVSGTLDTDFGTGGVVTTPIDAYLLGDTDDVIHAVALQPDGKIVAAGCADYGGDDLRIAVTRYQVSGTLDTSFGNNGIVTSTIVDGINFANAVALQPNGKIVVAGFVTTTNEFAVARYNEDGSSDITFGTWGAVVTHLSNGEDRANAVAVQPDGKIVAAGYAWGSVDTDYDFALTRYDVSGTLDTTFGTTGIVTTHIGFYDGVNALLLQPDGKIVAVGKTKTAESGEYDFAVARYEVSGTLDTSFGVGGIVTTTFGPGIRDEARDAVILQNGKIVAAGSSGSSFSTERLALACYNQDGSLDTTFGTDGITTTMIPYGDSRGRGIGIQPNGKLAVAGDYVEHGSGTYDFVLVSHFSPYIADVYLPMVVRMP